MITSIRPTVVRSRSSILNDGCQVNCPYCFQWNDPVWNHTILVKTNLPDVLAQELTNWDHSAAVYVGSRGDPYQPLEQVYGLTRRTLEVIIMRNCARPTRTIPG